MTTLKNKMLGDIQSPTINFELRRFPTEFGCYICYDIYNSDWYLLWRYVCRNTSTEALDLPVQALVNQCLDWAKAHAFGVGEVRIVNKGVSEVVYKGGEK